MMYHFSEAQSRIGTSSTKWDRYAVRDHIHDVIPLWVADMDFECLPQIQEAIIKRAKHPVFGYTDPPAELYDAIVLWEKNQHGIDITHEEIVLNTGVVYGFYTLIELLVKKTEKVIVQPPVYPPFFNTPYSLHREVIFNPLQHETNGYHMDIEGFEKLLQNDQNIRMFIMCNPHNPTGQCHTLNEINAIMKLCDKYDVWVVSDEIHADIIMPHQKHNSAFKCHKAYWDHLILLGSPTKTFNLAGLKISYAIVKNKEIKQQFARMAKANGLSSINIFAMEVLPAAYSHGALWCSECCRYIYDNFLFLQDFIKKRMPKVIFHIPQSTYLAWLDFSAYPVPDTMAQRLKYEAHVEVQAGIGFGQSYHKYQRVNVACPRYLLEEGMNRIYVWLRKNRLL